MRAVAMLLSVALIAACCAGFYWLFSLPDTLMGCG